MWRRYCCWELRVRCCCLVVVLLCILLSSSLFNESVGHVAIDRAPKSDWSSPIQNQSRVKWTQGPQTGRSRSLEATLLCCCAADDDSTRRRVGRDMTEYDDNPTARQRSGEDDSDGKADSDGGEESHSCAVHVCVCVRAAALTCLRVRAVWGAHYQCSARCPQSLLASLSSSVRNENKTKLPTAAYSAAAASAQKLLTLPSQRQIATTTATRNVNL